MTTPVKNEFTIRSAHQTLPLVKMIVEEIVELSTQISDTRERLDYLSDGRNSDDVQDEYAKELASIQLATDLKSKKVDQCVEELLELNVIPTGAADGYIDFPAVRENEQVCLCWRLGEGEVMHWHMSTEDCSKRRLVDLALIRKSGERSLV
ncbi:MAG: DUF2203 domain-containing protein [Mariniblastus sp.]